MLRSDRFLLAIVIGVVLLIAVAFFVAMRQEPPTYRADIEPDAVAFNYVLALQNGDYERAYDQLSSSVPGRPDTIERFVDDMVERGGGSTFGGSGTSSFRVDQADVAGDRAIVTLVESSFQSSGLFESGAYTEDFEVTLANDGGVWKVHDVDNWRHWHDCWSEPDREYCQRRLDAEPATPGPVAP